MDRTSVEKDFIIRPLTQDDQEWVSRFIGDHWGSDRMVVHGDVFIISRLPGFCAEVKGQLAGIITYNIDRNECEITSIDSLQPGSGIGSALIESVKAAAQKQNCARLRVTTTNDNIEALLFYQKRGFVLSELRKGAVIESRKMKPEIPETGLHGLPIRDEIELEMRLEPN